MDFSAYKDIWVFIETDEGKAASVGLELLNPGVELAHQLGQKVVAVILGKDNAEAEKAAIAHGADQVISLEDPAYGTIPQRHILMACKSWWKSTGLPF